MGERVRRSTRSMIGKIIDDGLQIGETTTKLLNQMPADRNFKVIN